MGEHHVINLRSTHYSDATFAHIDFSEQDIHNCVFTNCDFTGVNLSESTIETSTFMGCTFLKANLTECSIKECSFYDKEQQVGCDFRFSSLVGASFVNCDVSMCNFERVDMYRISFDACQAQGSNFHYANFTTALGRNKVVSSAFLTNTNFRYCDFEGVRLEKCDLGLSQFIDVNFSRANLDGTNLQGATLSPSNSVRLSICNADLRGAEIYNLDLRTLDLNGVKILDWQRNELLESLGFVIFPG